jgi:hypothetical protein
MSNSEPPDGAESRGTDPPGDSSHPSPHQPESSNMRRFGVWPLPPSVQIMHIMRAQRARRIRRVGLTILLVLVPIVIALCARRCGPLTAAVVPARAVPTVELHQESELSELRGSTVSASCPSCPSCPSCAAVSPELHQPAGLAASPPALRASPEARPAPRPSTPRSAPARHAKPRRWGDVVEPWEK